MAASLTTSAYYSRTTNLPTITAFSMMGWTYVTATGDRYALSFGDSSGQYFYAIGRATAGKFDLWNGSGDDVGSTMSLSTWYHIAIVVTGTGVDEVFGYFNGVLDITAWGEANDSSEKVMVGRTPADDTFTGYLAAFKFYDAILTAEEVYNEMRYYLPVRTSNLNTWCPFVTAETTDYSGNGYTLTATGTPTTVHGPPICWGPGRRRFYIPSGAAPPVVPKRNPMILMGV